MRLRILLAALLAGSAFSPAFAQEVEAIAVADTPVAAEAPAQVAQAVSAQPIMVAPAEREERRGRGEGGWARRDPGSEGMQSAPEQNERAPRQDWQQRPQVMPVPQALPQAQVQPQPDWSARRGGGNGNWQQREAPVVMAPPQAPVAENRGWRGNGSNEGGWPRGSEQRAIPPVSQNQGGWNRDNNGRDRTEGDWNRRDGDHGNDGRWNRQGSNNQSWQNRDGDRRWNSDRRWDNDRRWGNDRNWNNNRSWGNDRNWNGGQNWGGNNNQRWNREWRNDRRYDWERYRYSNRDLYRMPRYSSPYGYNYRYQRFGIGITLQSIFFGSRYRISDPWRYRLPDAQWPYEWVRYYDDVLLVDTRNGYVVDVIYDFFW